MVGIASYTAKKDKTGILLKRSYAGIIDTLHTKSFDEMMEWLTQDYPNSLHIVWKLNDFADAILSLLPKTKRNALDETNRVMVDNTKIFYVDKWFGLTYKKWIRGNIYEPHETNFFGLQHWMPSGTPDPDILELEKYGIAIVEALNKMGINPDKLTSPVGVWATKLSEYKLPTTYSNNEIIDASIYCEVMMHKEWRSAYKIGYFDKVYSYDLTSAYPYFLSNLPNTDKCKVIYSKEWLKCDWAIVKAEVDITLDKTPIVFDTEEGHHILPLGKRIDIFTTDELIWIQNHNAGTIKFIDGYFFKWLTNEKPYYKIINQLFDIRLNSDEMVSNLARRIGQGLSGKLDQDNKDGSLGEFYNPILAAITRSRCRLSVADFIWDNNLQDDLIVVQVDGLLSEREIPLNNNGNMGYWRQDAITPALILGKGEIWRPDKRPLNLGMDEVVKVMRAKPQNSYYEFSNDKFIDLNVMAMDIDRVYAKYPQSGYEALNSISQSEAIVI